MKLIKLICISFILFLTSSFDTFSKSMERDSIISISGQIIHADSLTPIPLATVSIKRTKKGIICDSSGVFHLQVQQYDTLQISALGYEPKEWVLPTKNNINNPFFTINLDKVSYLLEEVTISSWKNWADFKEEFIRTKAPKEDNLAIKFEISDVDMRNIKDEIAINNNPSFDFLGAFVYYGVKLFSKKKSPIIILSDEIKERHAQILISKFNKKLIAELTQEKGIKLDQLTAYINSQTNFTFESNELTIQSEILELYKKFKSNPDIITELKFVIDSSKQIKNILRP